MNGHILLHCLAILSVNFVVPSLRASDELNDIYLTVFANLNLRCDMVGLRLFVVTFGMIPIIC